MEKKLKLSKDKKLGMEKLSELKRKLEKMGKFIKELKIMIGKFKKE